MSEQSKAFFEDDGSNFISGAKNAAGLKISWAMKDKSMSAEFTPDARLQSWKGMVHGGVVNALLDDAMTHLVFRLHGACVMAEVTIRYLAPAIVGERLKLMGRIVDDSKRLVTAQAEVSKADGTPIARAESRILVLKGKPD
jgi:uncharacterized protein (TIGR00369 family)